MAVRGAGVNALTPGRSSAEPSQVGLGSRLVQKNQLGRVPARLLFAPAPACPEDVGTVLLTGAERLFLYVSPIFAKTTLIACKEQLSPVAARSSRSVKSFFLLSKLRNWLRWLATMVGLRPE